MPLRTGFLFFIIFLPGTNFSYAQSCNCPSMAKEGKGTLYFAGGYQRDFFSRSDLHFKNLQTDNYDFTLYDVKAVDRSGFKDILHEDITIPQYSFRIGYYFNNKKDIGIEINYDHVKYVMLQDQRVHMKGMIDGTYYDTDTVLTYNFLRYEHTNGANYCMLNFLKRINLFHAKNEKHWLSVVVKTGAGFLLPRTEVFIQGKHRNDKYHVGGYVLAADAGLRYDFFKNFLFETSLKGAFASYTNDLLPETGRAKHSFFSIETIATIGFQFDTK